MFFILSKVLFFIINPTVWIGVCLALGIFLKTPRLKKVFLILSFVFFLFFTNVAIFSYFAHKWEVPPREGTSITEKYKYVVVLGGMASYNAKTHKIEVSQSIDRLLQAIEVYKKGKAEKILITSGSGLLLRSEMKEANILSSFCASLGVEKHAIVLETNSRNTHENALFTKMLIGTNTKILLITSAFHMRRSIGCFKKEGFAFDFLSADPMMPSDVYVDDYFIPKAEPLLKWGWLMKEWIGYISYKLAGYI